MQGVSLAYGAGYVYVVRQSFFILFPVLSEEGCYLVSSAYKDSIPIV